MSYHLRKQVYLQLINDHVFFYDSLKWQKSIKNEPLYGCEDKCPRCACDT